jgi:hypothetical protein
MGDKTSEKLSNAHGATQIGIIAPVEIIAHKVSESYFES